MLVGREGSRRLVMALDSLAESRGLRRGIAVAKAQALVPGLVVLPADPAADSEALGRLAVWALRFSPVVAADPPDGLVIDSAGVEHLHGGEASMLSVLVERLAASGIKARAAIADTWGAAHAVARCTAKATAIVAPGKGEAVLRRLPVAALRLDEGLVRSLHTLGFERISDLLDQPRAPLALRFGPVPGRRLDQAIGIRAEPIEPVRPPDLVEVRRAFAEPIAAPETIVRYIGKLIAALCTALEARGLGARRLDLLCRRVDNSLQAIRVGTAQPVRDAKRLTRLLCDRIEKLDPGFGIEAMTLTAILAEPFQQRQAVASLAEEAEPDVSGLIDVLANRVGPHRIYRFAEVASDVPERSVTRIPPLAPPTGSNWQDDWPRPPRLFPQPEPVETMALLPDHPPVWFTWRGIRHRVRRADGPERVFGEWWQRDAELATVRDYFRVEDDAGERFWIFRAGDGEDPGTGSHRWFLHGIFG